MKKYFIILFLALNFACSPDEIQPGPSTAVFELKFKAECTEGSQGAWYFKVTEEFFTSFTRNNTIANCEVVYSVPDIDGNLQVGYFMGTRAANTN